MKPIPGIALETLAAVALLREHLPARVFKTVVPRSVRVAEAPSYGIPVSDHDPRSSGSKAYRALADEVLALGAVDG